MPKMQPVSPEMQRILQEKMARGEPLPPGYTAVPEGQVPPPGMIPTGVSTKSNGAPLQTPENLTAYNPIAVNNDSMALMRNNAECPLPNETALLQQHLQLLTALEGELSNNAIDITARGLAAYMHVGSFCTKNLRNRPVVTFSQDPELRELHDTIQHCTSRMETLQKEMQEIHTEARKALETRWKKSIENYGLNPEKNFYTVEEEKGTISLLTLDCAACKGKARIRHARQESQEYLQKVRLEKQKEENKKE